jgi:hypothetical protein
MYINVSLMYKDTLIMYINVYSCTFYIMYIHVHSCTFMYMNLRFVLTRTWPAGAIVRYHRQRAECQATWRAVLHGSASHHFPSNIPKDARSLHVFCKSSCTQLERLWFHAERNTSTPGTTWIHARHGHVSTANIKCYICRYGPHSAEHQ